jgi:glycosyltransferase involved in cell wall biosynthesis
MFRRLTERRGTTFIAVSEAVASQSIDYYRLRHDRIVTVLNGVDVTEFDAGVVAWRSNACCHAPVPQPASAVPPVCRMGGGPLIIGTAARLAPMKGLAYLIDAIAGLRLRGIGVELRIAGTGSQETLLRQRAEHRGLNGHVSFLGHVDSIVDFYRAIDLFVLPSVCPEGLPLTILEAMALGLPVVATRLAGTCEVIRDGIEGRLVPARDAAALGTVIAELVASPETRRALGDAGRARVHRTFRIERVAAEVRQMYDLIRPHTSRVLDTLDTPCGPAA